MPVSQMGFVCEDSNMPNQSFHDFETCGKAPAKENIICFLHDGSADTSLWYWREGLNSVFRKAQLESLNSVTELQTFT